jgi:hypothetical protein
MKLVTIRSQIRDVAKRWHQQYGPGNPYSKDLDKISIGKALDRLDTESATADDVAAIIGNRSWAEEKECDECGAKGDVVEVGEEPDYESRTAMLCYGCVCKALALLQP